MLQGAGPSFFQTNSKNAPQRLRDKVMFRISFFNAVLSLFISPYFAYIQNTVEEGAVVVIVGICLSMVVSAVLCTLLDIFYLITKYPKNWVH